MSNSDCCTGTGASFSDNSSSVLVVAVCQENLSWISTVAPGYSKVYVYDKCRPEREALAQAQPHIQAGQSYE